jgi:DNA helicase HerA-like ATPase
MLCKVVDIKGPSQTNTNSTDSNIEVIDLKNVNLELKKVIPLLICKTNYDEQKNRRDNDKENSLHIIIDEAHSILSENSNRESESWKDYRLETFEEIIKEGRKFGVFLTVASQRPSDISPTIISQLHNYFIHKLMNENDLRSINRAVSYLDKLSFDSISNLSTGCCFIAGQMTQFPLSVKVKLLDKNNRPQSETIDLNDLWKNKRATST